MSLAETPLTHSCCHFDNDTVTCSTVSRAPRCTGKGLVWVGGGRFLVMVEMPIAAGGEMDIVGKWERSAQQKLRIEVRPQK